MVEINSRDQVEKTMANYMQFAKFFTAKVSYYTVYALPVALVRLISGFPVYFGD